MPGLLVFPSREPGVSGDIWGSQEGCQGPFRPSCADFQKLRRATAMITLSVVRESIVCDGELREPLVWRQGSQVSMRVARGNASLLSSHGRGIGGVRPVAPPTWLVPDTPGSLEGNTNSPGTASSEPLLPS